MITTAIFKTILVLLVVIGGVNWVHARAAAAGQQVDSHVTATLACAYRSASTARCPGY